MLLWNRRWLATGNVFIRRRNDNFTLKFESVKGRRKSLEVTAMMHAGAALIGQSVNLLDIL